MEIMLTEAGYYFAAGIVGLYRILSDTASLQ